MFCKKNVWDICKLPILLQIRFIKLEQDISNLSHRIIRIPNVNNLQEYFLVILLMSFTSFKILITYIKKKDIKVQYNFLYTVLVHPKLQSISNGKMLN